MPLKFLWGGGRGGVFFKEGRSSVDPSDPSWRTKLHRRCQTPGPQADSVLVKSSEFINLLVLILNAFISAL